jgi:hypothetical protein
MTLPAASALGGVVAIVSALSFLAPPGQTLVQEPAVPAHSGLLTNLPDAPRHGPPAPLTRAPANGSVVRTPPTATQPVGTAGAVLLAPLTPQQPDACVRSRMLACVAVRTPAADGPTMRAAVCPGAATVTVEYAPQIGPTRTAFSRTVEVGSCSS